MTSSARPNRLTTITTRTGDQGATGLADGSRVAKHDARIHALGDVDEFNSTLGLLRCEVLPAGLDDILNAMQHDLFDLGAELALPGHTVLKPERVVALEAWLAQYQANLPPLREFVLPGGSRPAAQAHVARSQARRAERSLWALHALTPLSPAPLQYLNRASDLLFVLARELNRVAGRADVFWQRAAEA